MSVPNVNNAIENGEAQITGNMTYDEADTLASTIRIGGLQLELEELRSNVVGAQRRVFYTYFFDYSFSFL